MTDQLPDQPNQPDESYHRPATAVELSGTEKMFVLRALRTVEAPHRIRRLIDQNTLWAHQAAAIAEHLEKAAKTARPLSRNRRLASRLARRYRAAANTARQAPINPDEWPEAPHKRSALPIWNEAAATATWAVVAPTGPEEALQC